MSSGLAKTLVNQCLKTQQTRFLTEFVRRPLSYAASTSLSSKPKSHHTISARTLNFGQSRISTIEPAQNRLYSEKTGAHTRIEGLVSGKPLVVFMKGTPEQPMCGFSNAVCQILRMHGVPPYDSYNVLEDEELRQGIKEYSNWPTIPQVYLGGEFVGGCDIMIDMHKSGELIEELKKVGIKSDLED